MKNIHRWFYVMLLCSFVSAVTIAQSDCPTIVASALQEADAKCADVGRNQACYGNIMLKAEPQTDGAEFVFDVPGDVVGIGNMKTLELSSMDAAAGEWGVAILRIQANLSDTSPGQNVLMVMFGDVQIENKVVGELPSLELTSTAGVNVRLRPTTDATVLKSLQRGDVVKATGRLEDSSWVRIEVPDDSRDVGWVSVQYLSGNDLETLNVVDPSTPIYGPMQAFFFKTGINDSPCAEAPDSGLLVQTPEGVGRITLLVNEVNIQLGSTLYLQAQPSGDMVVNVVEGSALVTSQGVDQFVPAGTRVRVALDAEQKASGPPSTPEPYDATKMQSLPLALLERDISVNPALTQAEIEAASTSTLPGSTGQGGTNLLPGPRVVISSTCPSGVCGAGFLVNPPPPGCGNYDPANDAGGAPNGTIGVILDGPVFIQCPNGYSYNLYKLQMENGVIGWTNEVLFTRLD